MPWFRQSDGGTHISEARCGAPAPWDPHRRVRTFGSFRDVGYRPRGVSDSSFPDAVASQMRWREPTSRRRDVGHPHRRIRTFGSPPSDPRLRVRTFGSFRDVGYRPGGVGDSSFPDAVASQMRWREPTSRRRDVGHPHRRIRTLGSPPSGPHLGILQRCGLPPWWWVIRPFRNDGVPHVSLLRRGFRV